MIESLIIILSLLAIIFIDANGDASKGHWGNISKDLLLGLIPLSAVLSIELGWDLEFIWRLVGAYLALRIGFFNPIWNLSSKQKWYYFGTTKIWDKFNNKLKQYPIFLQLVYIVGGLLTAMTLTGFWENLNK